MKFAQLAFPKGKHKAFTLSYDDGVIQDRRLVKMMNAHGIKGTFNLNSDFFGVSERALIDGFDTDITKLTKEEAKALYSGHEIATHGATHMKFTDVSNAVVAHQIINDRETLEDLTGSIITGLAYPFGVYNKETIATLTACGITYARTVVSTGAFELPEDFMQWHPTCHHNDEKLMDYAEQFCTKPCFFDIPELFYVWGHSYEFDQKNNWEQIERLLAYVAPYKEKVWFATNGEIQTYVDCFRKLIYSAAATRVYNPTAIDLWACIDGQVISIPSGKTIEIQ